MAVRAAPDAEERVDLLRRGWPAAYELARVLSMAARVERPLLRRARVTLLDVDASAEADLWTSPVIASQTAQGFVFERRCAEVLRARLADDPQLLEDAWRLLAWEHRTAPWPVRVEELINRLTARGDASELEQAEEVLVAAAQKMLEATERKAVGQWVMRTLMRLPPAMDASPVRRALHAGVGAQVGGRLALPDDLPPDAVETWMPWLLSDALDPVHVGVALTEGGYLELDAATTTENTIAVPGTAPLLIDVQWHDGRAPHAHRVTLERGQRERVQIGVSEATLRTVDGRCTRVRRAGLRSQDAGLDFAAVRARHRPFYGRERELDEIDAKLGQVAVLGIVGREGVGKTALLCAYLDRIEARGVQVLVHFLNEGPGPRPGARTVHASLLAQLGPGAEAPPDDFGPSFGQRMAWQTGERLVVVALDGLVHDDVEELLAPWTRERFPASIRLVYTAEAAITELPMQDVVDLDERVESNQDVCRQYYEAHAAVVEKKLAELVEHPRVFISYLRQDAALASTVKRMIEDAGMTVSSDSEQLVPGEDWSRHRRRLTREADGAVVIVSPTSASSEYVVSEVQEFLRSRKPMLPISLDARAAHKALDELQLSMLNTIDLRGRNEPEGALTPVLHNFMNALRARRLSILDLADGNIGRLVAMIRWVAAQPDGTVRVEMIPPTLSGRFEEVWARVSEDAIVLRVAGLLTAAAGELSVTWIAQLADVARDDLDQALDLLTAQGFVIVRDEPRVIEDENGRPSGTIAYPHVRLSDESLRGVFLWQLDPGVLQSAHYALASYPEYDYQLRRRWHHLVAAGDIDTARMEATNLETLQRVCEALGADALRQQLELVLKATERPPQAEMA